MVADVDAAKDAPSASKHWSAAEILENLFNNLITKTAAKQLLMLRIAKAGIDPEERQQLKDTLGAVEAYSNKPEELDHEESVSKAAKELQRLQQLNGKRVGTLIATHRRVYHDLHLKHRSPTMQQAYKNAETGETMVTAEQTQDVSDSTILHMVLIDFIYVCTAYLLLTATEGRALHKWTTKQLYVNNGSATALHRTVTRLLQHLDESHESDLSDVIDAHADRYLKEENDLARPQGGPCVQPATRQPSKSNGMPAKGSSTLIVPYPRKGVCWPHTNGYDCCEFDAYGACVFIKEHNTCGVRYKNANGNHKFCMEHHQAINCPKKDERC